MIVKDYSGWYYLSSSIRQPTVQFIDRIVPKWQSYYFHKWQVDGTSERLNWQLNRVERTRQIKHT